MVTETRCEQGRPGQDQESHLVITLRWLCSTTPAARRRPRRSNRVWRVGKSDSSGISQNSVGLPLNLASVPPALPGQGSEEPSLGRNYVRVKVTIRRPTNTPQNRISRGAQGHLRIPKGWIAPSAKCNQKANWNGRLRSTRDYLALLSSHVLPQTGL